MQVWLGDRGWPEVPYCDAEDFRVNARRIGVSGTMPSGGVTLLGVSLWVPSQPRIHVKTLDHCYLYNSGTMHHHPLWERCRGASVPLVLSPLSLVDKFGSCLEALPALAWGCLGSLLSHRHDLVIATLCLHFLLVGSALHGLEWEGRRPSSTTTRWVWCDDVLWFL
jgi:hypothetical protein